MCNKCYKKLESEAKFNIEKNNELENEFFEHIYFFKYEGFIRRIILEYKFQDKSYLYKTIANFLLKNEKLFEIIKSYDTIVPVPISKNRKKERGYNQSYLISKEISDITRIKLENNCIFKSKNINEQSKLNKEERLINIKNAYEIKSVDKLRDKNILLFDDVYTTGSTVRECCKILKKASPKKIGILTIAKD